LRLSPAANLLAMTEGPTAPSLQSQSPQPGDH
jgi:hypothetical protein